VSCAKGDAIPEIHARYPELKLFGADISEVAIAEARNSFGNIAEFYVGGFDDLQQRYDVILCSNTLEHFENYVEVAEGLLKHCRWLYIMVPFMELRNGQRLRPEPGEQHVATFDERSFDALVARGAAQRIESWVLYTPGAWGIGKVPRWRKLLARVRGKQPRQDLRQIIFQVESAAPLAPNNPRG
jgi:hypothetical protein